MSICVNGIFQALEPKMQYKSVLPNWYFQRKAKYFNKIYRWLHARFTREEILTMLSNFLDIFYKVYVAEFGSFFSWWSNFLHILQNSHSPTQPPIHQLHQNTTALSHMNSGTDVMMKKGVCGKKEISRTEDWHWGPGKTNTC